MTLVVLVVFWQREPISARGRGADNRCTPSVRSPPCSPSSSSVPCSSVAASHQPEPSRTEAADDSTSGTSPTVAWTAHPVLGLGAGSFQPESARLLQETPGVELSPNNPLLTTGIKVHNVYLENLVETGPLGLGAWLLLVGVPARKILRRSRAGGRTTARGARCSR